MIRGLTLPPIAGKPYKQPLRLKPYQVEEPCAEGEKCTAPCWCSETVYGRYHTKGDHADRLHSHTRTVDPEDLAPSGSGRLERKASGELVYHTPWTKKHTPFARSAAAKEAKPRVESSAKAYMRLLKECAAFTTDQVSANKAIGQTAANGYKIVSTNGHFALLAAGDGQHTVAPHNWLGSLEGYQAATLNDPELYLALQRAKIMADERSRAVTLLLEGEKATLYSSASNVGDFTGTAGCQVSEPFAVSLDWRYLELALGVWPLTLWFKTAESPLVFEPASREWRFVLAPMRGDDLETMRKRVHAALSEG